MACAVRQGQGGPHLVKDKNTHITIRKDASTDVLSVTMRLDEGEMHVVSLLTLVREVQQLDLSRETQRRLMRR